MPPYASDKAALPLTNCIKNAGTENIAKRANSLSDSIIAFLFMKYLPLDTAFHYY